MKIHFGKSMALLCEPRHHSNPVREKMECLPILSDNSSLSSWQKHQWRTIGRDITRSHRKLFPTLDLSRYPSWAVSRISAEVSEFLDDHVKTVHLPPGLTETPPWVANLALLQNLTVPGFKGNVISLNSKKLARVEVPIGVLVENRRKVDSKTCVLHKKGKKIVNSSTAIGQIYHAQKINAKKLVDFNCKVKFLGRDEEISCAHIALKYILDAQNMDAKKDKQNFCDDSIIYPKLYKSKYLIDQLGSLEKLQANIDVRSKDRYLEILATAPDRSIVSHQQWGKFFAAEFEKMNGPGRAYFFVVAGRHAVGVILRAKLPEGEPSGKLLYVVEVYDPNFTLDYRRVVEIGRKNIEKLSADILLCAESHKYYKSQRNSILNGPLTTFIALPFESHLKRQDEPFFKKSSSCRWHVFVDVQDSDNPALLSCLIDSKASLQDIDAPNLRFADALKKVIISAPAEKKMEILHVICERMIKIGAVGLQNVVDILVEVSKKSVLGLAYVFSSMEVCLDCLQRGVIDMLPQEVVSKFRDLINRLNLSCRQILGLYDSINKRVRSVELERFPHSSQIFILLSEEVRRLTIELSQAPRMVRC